MKTFCFFSEKGGVGKTTLTIFFAAYLAYCCGKKVKVIDTEAPTFRICEFRKKEEILLQRNEPNPLSNYAKSHTMPLSRYDIDCRGCAVNTYTVRDRQELVRSIQRDINDNKYDYELIDFPAGYSENTPITDIVRNGLLDLVYIPTSTETQERRSAFIVAQHMKSLGQDVRILWNRINPAYMKSPELLIQSENQIEAKIGVKHSAVRIKAFNKATQAADVNCFTRTTICWPKRYIEMACPELKNLFKEIVDILDTKE